MLSGSNSDKDKGLMLAIIVVTHWHVSFVPENILDFQHTLFPWQGKGMTILLKCF
jgi:hypothetical protein